VGVIEEEEVVVVPPCGLLEGAVTGTTEMALLVVGFRVVVVGDGAPFPPVGLGLLTTTDGRCVGCLTGAKVVLVGALLGGEGVLRGGDVGKAVGVVVG